MSGTADALTVFEAPADLAVLNIRLPALFLGDPKASKRFWEFFAANIRNKNTRRAYYKAACRFSDWCEGRGLFDLARIRPIDVAAYVEGFQETHSKPTVKQHLAALRMLFDWLVVGHTLNVNPAHAVRGPKHVVKKGKTPVLNADEARLLLDSIDTGSLIGLRDCALIAVMTYTFARVGAAVSMRVEDYFIQGRRGWLRLHEKGGTRHEVPAITISINIWRRISRLQRWKEIRRGSVSHGGRKDGEAHAKAYEPSGRLPNDSQAGQRRGHSDKDWKPHVPCDGHYCLPQERR